MELAPGIHHFATGPFNWYLIEQSGRLTLIDAGFPGHYSVFQAGLRSLNRSPKDLEAIVLTHAHADHTGFAQRLSTETGAPIWIHKDDATMAQRVLQLPWAALLSNAWRPFTASMLTRATWNGVFTFPSLSNPQTFHDEQTLDIPGKPRLLHLPGHTAGQSVVFLEDRNILFSSDTLITRDLFTGAHTPPSLPAKSLNADHAQASQSLQRLASLGDREILLLPGHGRPWKGRLSEAIQKAC